MLQTIKKIAQRNRVDDRLTKRDLQEVNLYMSDELHMIQSDLEIEENQQRVANILLGIVASRKKE